MATYTDINDWRRSNLARQFSSTPWSSITSNFIRSPSHAGRGARGGLGVQAEADIRVILAASGTYALYASKLGIPILLRLYFRLMRLLRLCAYGTPTFSATLSSDKSESKNEWNVCIETSLSLRESI
jgi:hypothetical protein